MTQDQETFHQDVVDLSTELGEAMFPLLNKVMAANSGVVSPLVAVASVTNFCAYALAATVRSALSDDAAADPAAVTRTLDAVEDQLSQQLRSAYGFKARNKAANH